MQVIAVGRDTSFAIAVLSITSLLLHVTLEGSVQPWPGVALGAVLAAGALLRHNGPILAVAVLGAVAWCFWHEGRRGVILAALVCVVGVITVTGPLYRLESVAPPSPMYREQLLIHQVAALVSAGTPLADDERAFLDSIMPLSRWRSAYTCSDSDALLFRSGLREEPLAREPFALPSIWAHLAVRNPGALFRHWRCVTGFLWRNRSDLRIGRLSADGGTVAPNTVGLAPASRLPAVRTMLTGFCLATSARRSPLRALVWQPAGPLYVFLAALLVALWRARSPAPLLVWLPGLCNTFVWLVFAPAPAIRCQWPVVLLTPALVVVAAINWRRASGMGRRGSGQADEAARGREASPPDG